MCGYLQKQGLRLITQNFFTLFGELDLIMQEDNCLVFVEVRYRKTNHFMHVLETVSQQKQKKLTRSALCYLQQNPLWRNCRFDVIAVTPTQSNYDIHWIKDAFQVQ